MKVKEAYAEWAASYDQDANRTRDLDEQVARATLSQERFNSILELGCGTGKNTTMLAGIGAHVIAVDFSEAMIEKARQKSTLNNVRFIVSDITERWPIAEGSVDLVTCNLVLEHVENLGFIFREAARVLTTGGRLFVSELHPFRQYQGVVARFERDAARIEIPAFVHHISDFLAAATSHTLALLDLKEWWHAEDENKPPRLISFVFSKSPQ